MTARQNRWRYGLAGVFLALIFASGPLGCREAPLPNVVTQAEADQLALGAPEESRGVIFGGRYELLAAALDQRPAGLRLDLVWKSLARQKRVSLVPVHLVDASGAILAQADYKMDKDQRVARANTIWRDTVTIPYEQLAGCSSIAVGLLNPGEQWLQADRGPRDWGDRRLLVPLPSGLPRKGTAYNGFLEDANSQTIVGWAWNQQDKDTPVAVEILADGQALTNVAAEEFRQDLQAGGIGDGRHGFRASMPAGLRDGAPHTIHARIAGTLFELRNSPRGFDFKKPGRESSAP